MMKSLHVFAIALVALLGTSGQSQASIFDKLKSHSSSHTSSHSEHSGKSSGESGGTSANTKALFNNLMAGVKDVCSKGSFFSGKITIRSFEGKLCNNKIIAALAKMKCGKNADFGPSHCGQNANRVLAGQEPKAVLMAEMKKGSAMAKAAFHKFFPGKQVEEIGGEEMGEPEDMDVDTTPTKSSKHQDASKKHGKAGAHKKHAEEEDEDMGAGKKSKSHAKPKAEHKKPSKSSHKVHDEDDEDDMDAPKSKKHAKSHAEHKKSSKSSQKVHDEDDMDVDSDDSDEDDADVEDNDEDE